MDGPPAASAATAPPPPPDAAGEEPPRPDTWVPVQDRVLGLDKRSFVPALVVLAFLLFFAVALPALDRSTELDDPVEAGDVMDLGLGRLVLTPAVGWNVDEGLRYSPDRVQQLGATTTVSKGGAEVSVRVGPFEGTPDELLDQINKENDDLGDRRGLGRVGPRNDIEVAGTQGVTETFTGLAEKGVVVAFVEEIDGQSVGIEVTIRGFPSAIDDAQEDIAAMVESIRAQAAPNEEGN
jgi:hypothetical protein